MSGSFEQSLDAGPHALLARTVGRWRGMVRTWFEADVLADESPIRGEIRSVLGGRFVAHEYSYELQGAHYAALALHGFDLQAGCFTIAWIDGFHSGTTTFLSRGAVGERERCSVLCSYSDGQGGPDWGWRIEIAMPDADKLLIMHYNITPDGEEAKAVEIEYARVN